MYVQTRQHRFSTRCKTEQVINKLQRTKSEAEKTLEITINQIFERKKKKKRTKINENWKIFNINNNNKSNNNNELQKKNYTIETMLLRLKKMVATTLPGKGGKKKSCFELQDEE